MIICMQKITFITYFFLKILQRNSKLAILRTLSMSGFAHPKWYYQLVEKFSVYQKAKNQLHSPCFSGDIPKMLQTCNLGYFEHAWLCTPKVIISPCRKPLRLSTSKKSTLSPLFSGDISEICKFVILYFGHV